MLFIDFDDCLFCTRDFVRDMKAIFARYGVDGAMYDATRAASYSDAAHEGKGVYSPVAHAALLAQTMPFALEGLTDDLRTFYTDTRRYVFADTTPFLADYAADRLVLLTYGDQEFQSAKIAGSGIADAFAAIIITQGDKVDAIAAYRAAHGSGEGCTVFIDDRVGYLAPVKRALPDIVTVLLARPEGRYHDTPDTACDIVAANFADVAAHIS